MLRWCACAMLWVVAVLWDGAGGMYALASGLAVCEHVPTRRIVFR